VGMDFFSVGSLIKFSWTGWIEVYL
jgi:hypothetical protein